MWRRLLPSNRETAPSRAVVVVPALVLLALPSPLLADCTIFCDNPTFLSASEEGNVDGDAVGRSRCFSPNPPVNQYCETPVLLGETYSLDDPLCDVHGTVPCAITAESRWHFPANGSNACFQGITINAGWLLDDSNCGLSVSGTLDTDLGTAQVHYDATCGNPGSLVLRALACQGAGSCHRETQLTLDLASSALCNPRPAGCGEGDPGSGLCCFGPGDGSSPDGSPPGFGVPGTNARLVYQAEGVGHPGAPGAPDWIGVSGLGRYWIHEFATRIVSPSGTTAWLITEGGTFRRYTDVAGDGFYESVVPTDEDRILERDLVTGGWTLTALDGTVKTFGSGGSWQGTTDRFGNAWTASYASGLLSAVSFPDGRQELFTYSGGRLAAIQQVGLEDDATQASGSPADCSSSTECRTWSFTWSGDNLARVEYPDGTAREFFYADAPPGFMTRRELVGTDGTSRRVEAAWEYTVEGRILRTWSGASSFSDPEAVDRWEFSFYDDPTRPTEVDVTDPFGQVVTYQLGYETDSVRPRLESVSGTCPSCGGPDDQYEYDDPLHPLRPTARIDGDGGRTELTYNATGTVAVRREAVGTAQARTITYDYDPLFPGLRTLERRPSTDGVGFRDTTWSYDGSGLMTSMTQSGAEAGYDLEGDGVPENAFTLITTYSGHNAAGQPGQIDPPGHGIADVTAFTYAVPGRNGLLVETRTDPVIGTTSYEYDGLNRRTVVVDPNGVETETVYDPLDRAEQVTSAAGLPEALTTEYHYTPFRDLAAVVHPRGNVTAYGYDPAGRVTEIRRQAGELLAIGDERTFYTLNGYGQRVREDQQVWDGGTWQTTAATSYEYSSRCYLDRVIHDPDAGGTEVTEYGYDCDRNLSAVWDANHPSASHPPSQVYVYDALDRLVEMRQPWVPGTDCRGAVAPAGCSVTRHVFDVQDHLVQVTDAESNVTDYVYSDRDLMTHEVSPVSGTSSHRYDDHGEWVERVDGRGVTIRRTLDPADRPIFVDHPDDTLDVVYAYDAAPAACPVGASFPVGRLASISRDGASVDYCYDVHGRTTRDGALAYTFDPNGNVATMEYPGGVEATYEYDFADRPTSLSVTTPASGVAQPVVGGASYLPGGPLAGFTFGNGTTETRTFTARYFPEAITWADAGAPTPSVRAWIYQTDAVGNVLSIEAPGTCAGDVPVANQVLSDQQEITSCADLVLGPDLTLTATADITFRAAGAVRLLDGFAAADAARMAVESGADVQPPSDLRVFEYQDGPYFLTRADGPWGQRDWTYDRIGDRLSETRDRSGSPQMDTYVYTPNGNGGHTALLDEVLLSPTGTADYAWDPAGNLETLTRGANQVDFTFDAAGRLAALDRGDGVSTFASADLLYDGRGFLRQAADPATGATVEPLYDSSGLLHALSEVQPPPAPARRHTIFYLAGRPVAQLTQEAGADTWQYLTTDHLGTPLLAADATGTVTWSGGFEPFGQDPAAGTPAAALAHDLFLRLPGQWETGLWAEAALGSGGVHYNVYRWYTPGTGRYSRPDPIRWGTLGVSSLAPMEVYQLAAEWKVDPARQIAYSYVANRPLFYVDPGGRFFFDRTCGEAQARRALKEATNVANQPGFPGGPGGLVDGPGDAYRHCLWSCLMQENCGWSTAFLGGWGHELEDWTYASGMDTFNNDQGRECAASGSCPCDQCCMQQLQKGALQIQTTGGVSESGAGYGF